MKLRSEQYVKVIFQAKGVAASISDSKGLHGPIQYGGVMISP
jgi:hypothetical protein